jgi:hypothetical protein
MNAATRRNVYQRLRRLGPYALIELLLPGGTIIALLLWLCSGGPKGHFAEPQRMFEPGTAVVFTLGGPGGPSLTALSTTSRRQEQ